MPRYGMVIDITKCNGCYNCFLACRDEYCGNDFPPYSLAQPPMGQFWMRIMEREIGKYPQAVKVAYTPLPCMHCEDASCVKAATSGEIYRTAEGIVIIDPEKARGQKHLVASCPYRVIYWNEEKNIPQKCTFCAHLLQAGWKEPRCVEACPTKALVFGDLDDPLSDVAKLMAGGATEVLRPGYGMGEKVVYIGLPKRFISGSLVFGDTDECAENVTIELISAKEKTMVKTNNYGDFQFAGLPQGKEYVLKIAHPGYKPRRFKVNTRADASLGDITLRRK
jgi:Fe-S-cluster-containing dehydrogenase component